MVINIRKKEAAYSFTTILLLIGSFVQFGDYLVARYFVPLVVLFLGLLLYLSQVKLRASKVVSKFSKLHFIVFLLFVILSFLGNVNLDEIIFDFGKLFLAFGLSFFVFYSVYYASNKAVHVAVIVATSVVILVLCLDTYFRFSGFSYERLASNFYIYKVNSPFFVDSNAVALYALFGFSLFYYYYLYQCNRSCFLLLALLFLIFLFILLSFSRASIIALFVLLIFSWYFRRSYYFKINILFLSVFIFFLSVPMIISMVNFDGSGSTKVGIYVRFWDLFWLQDILPALVGHGINEGNYVYSYEEGKYSHALIPMVTGQFGLFGLVLYFFFFLYSAWITKGHSLYAFIPAFVAGLSYLHPFLETLFVANAFIVGIYLKSRGRAFNA